MSNRNAQNIGRLGQLLVDIIQVDGEQIRDIGGSKYAGKVAETCK